MSYNQSALRLMKNQQYDEIIAILDSSVLQTQRIANLLTQYHDKLKTGSSILQPVNILSILITYSNGRLVDNIPNRFQFAARWQVNAFPGA
ncbi:hypothetical protein [Photorhabdus heterorhabditis]